MKKIMFLLALTVAVFAQTNLVRVPASTVGGSGAKCQLRGVAGTRTAAIDSINGVYNNPYFEFTVTTSGRYDLYYDSNGTTGGLSYSKQTDWSGDYGRWIDGLTDAERALTFQETADTDNDGKVETAGLEDSVVTAVKIISNTVKTIHLQNSSVTTPKISDDAVTASKMADDAVTLPTLADDVLAYVATGGDFNSDTLRAIVSDSLAALSADGVTVLNDGAFKQKAFLSTTELDSVAADSANMNVFVGQVGSSGVGAGFWVWKPSGYTADGGTVLAGSSGYWVREERLKGIDITPKMFGAVGDNSTDDTDELRSYFSSINTNNLNGFIPAGIYLVSDSILIKNDGIKISGVPPRSTNYSQTTISAIKTTSTTSPAIVFAGNGSDLIKYPMIENLTLIGPGKATSNSQGIRFGDINEDFSGDHINLRNIRIEGFESGIDKWGTAQDRFDMVVVENCTYGMRLLGGSSAIHNSSFFANTSLYNCDTLLVAKNSTGQRAITFQGGDWGIANIFADLSGVQLRFSGMNWERCTGDSAFVIAQFGSQVEFNNMMYRVLSGGGGQHLPIVSFGNTSYVFVTGSQMDDLDTVFAVQETQNSRIWSELPVEVIDRTSGETFWANSGLINRVGAVDLRGATSGTRGLLESWFSQGGTYDADHLIYHQNVDVDVDTFTTVFLTDGNDWNISNNGGTTAFTRSDRLWFGAGSKGFTRADGTDSTLVTFTLPFTPDAVYSVMPTIEVDSNIRGSWANYKSQSSGTLNFVVHHPTSIAGSTTFNGKLHAFICVIKPLAAY